MKEGAFRGAYNLRHVTLGSNTGFSPRAFQFCLSLEVLVASVGFELGTSGKIGRGAKDGRLIGGLKQSDSNIDPNPITNDFFSSLCSSQISMELPSGATHLRNY